MSTFTPRTVAFRLGLPKGRMEQAVLTLLADAGIRVRPSARGYRPDVSLPGAEAKMLKPQNIVEMLALGSRDIGFAGSDWVAERRGGRRRLLTTPDSDPMQSSRRLRGVARKRTTAQAAHCRVGIQRPRGAGSARAVWREFVRSYGATECFLLGC